MKLLFIEHLLRRDLESKTSPIKKPEAYVVTACNKNWAEYLVRIWHELMKFALMSHLALRFHCFHFATNDVIGSSLPAGQTGQSPNMVSWPTWSCSDVTQMFI